MSEYIPAQRPEGYDHVAWWYLEAPWRVGRKLGRTVYAGVGPDPSDDDVLIGVMDYRELAEHIVALHNQALSDGSVSDG
jgi:hypothetical protein